MKSTTRHTMNKKHLSQAHLSQRLMKRPHATEECNKREEFCQSRDHSLKNVNCIPKVQANVQTSRRHYFQDWIFQYFVPHWWNEPEFFCVRPKPSSTSNEASGDRPVAQPSVHHQTDSLFSSSSGFNNYRGLLNLCIILLVVSNARVALENIIKYGILVNPLQWISVLLHKPDSWPTLSLSVSLISFVVITYLVEVLLSKDKISEGLGRFIHIITLTIELVFPAAVILYVHPNPIFSCFCLGQSTIQFLKLVSYVCTNKWCRDANRGRKKKKQRNKSISHDDSGPSFSVPQWTPKNLEELSASSDSKSTADVTLSQPLVHYPNNLNVRDIAYFMVAPTLCYELNFPRSARIRKRFLVKRVLEMIFLAQVIMGLIQQWIIPTVSNSLVPFHNSEWSRIIERLLKLAIPNHLIWLIFFYWFFHSCLNVIAELTKFGDREFYKDWWNAESVMSFWSTWNMPVHRWARRHVYLPMLEAKFSKMTASVFVFVISAFFHEYLVSVPLRMPRLWAFFAMLGQVPYAVMVTKYLHAKLGNMAVWVSIILGQPLAILMYAHDYYINYLLNMESAT